MTKHCLLAGRHLRIRPEHPWTIGKTEQRFYAPVLMSLVHVQSFCADVLGYYNHCRPHSSHWGLTPDERDSDRAGQPVVRRQAFFDGQLLAYRIS